MKGRVLMTGQRTWSRPGLRRLVLPLTLLIVLALAVPLARATPLPEPDEFPRVAFVARNDVPFDALTVGPVAGALGGIAVLTPPSRLGDAARDALVAFDPDLVVIAGGQAAVSADAQAQIAAAGDWDVVRKAGPGRDETAAELATLLTDLGAGRPAILGDGQVVGDLHVGGLVHADDLAVESRMVFTDTLETNLASLAGATSAATALEILAIEDLPAGEYVITGTALAGGGGATNASVVHCETFLDGTRIHRTASLIGTDAEHVRAVSMPLSGHGTIPTGTADLRVRCWVAGLSGPAPAISGGDNLWTQLIATRIP